MTIVGLSLRVDVAQRKQLEVAINYWHGARNVFQRCIVRTVLLDMYHIHTCIREYYEHAGKRGVFHEVERLMKYWILQWTGRSDRMFMIGIIGKGDNATTENRKAPPTQRGALDR